MFYEEKVINGVLHCRGTPHGEWTALSAIELTTRIMIQKAELWQQRNIIADQEMIIADRCHCN